MINYKKISLFTAAFTLILGLSISSSYAQMKDKAPQPEMYKLTGEVVDAETGKALNEVKVVIAGKDIEEKTGENGTFTFDKLPAGPHTLIVEEVGYKTWEKKVKLNKDAKLTIEVKPGK